MKGEKMGISKGLNYQTGRYVLDCDKCGELGARRMSCPIRYCSPVQLCAPCAKAIGWRKKATHAKCYESQTQLENDRVNFLAENGDKWIATTAWGSWCEWVPDKMVGVCAYRGGNAAGRTGEPAYFLIPENEYQTRGENGFIIDESRHFGFSNDPTRLESKEIGAA